MSPSPRTRLLAAAVALLALAPLAACGTANGSSGAPAGDNLVIGISRKLTALDPAKGSSVDGDGSIQRAIYEGLTSYDANQQLQPQLATSWQQTDQTTWTFTLRDGVTFSDGSPFTASDVVFTFNRYLDPNTKITTAAAVKAFVSSVEAPDDHTVVIHTKGPYLDLPDRLANFFIQDETFVKAHPDDVKAAVGTGPYVLDTVDLENGATLHRNDSYWGAEPQWKTVAYKVLETEAARVQAAQAGSIDVAIQYEPADLKLFGKSKDYTTGSQWSSWNNTLRLNENIKPLDDVRVRQALNYAIDKQAIIRDVLGADVQPLAGQALAAPYDKVNPDLTAYPYDPAKARQLLAEAGYPQGFDIELGLSTGTYVAQDAAAQVIAKQLGEVGVRVNITQQAFPNWVQRTYSDQNAPGLYYIGYTSGYKAIAERLRTYATSNAQTHYAQPDTTYDGLVAKVTTATTAEEQQQYANQATAQFRDQAHVVFLWPQPLTYVVRKNLQWTPRPEHWLEPQEFSPKAS
ncbi:ABC transporter substrate-binding protein [Raineyella sp. W15-4]|uniref:ABC transporter substrate-binding protein n=1 Tax=Raineyella sp. W15-4 TaxID=3081651 RepID=UPI002953C00B|nr:ABC transporter substrate-binding protein [Raineyella sp. W15-4]WOQ16117.1 ABC transporter substrate-binding protein [Raineyella sp. W15-4]